MTSDADVLLTRLRALLNHGQRVRQRQLVVLSGSRAWGRAQLEATATLPVPPEGRLWLGTDPPPWAVAPAWEHLEPEQATTVLGRELGLVVVDGHAGLDADALGAVAGTVVAGGLLVLLMPGLAGGWQDMADPLADALAAHPWPPEAVGRRFAGRMARLITADPTAWVVHEGQNLPELPGTVDAAPEVGEPIPQVATGECWTAEQAAAVDALCHVLTGQRRRPVVLVADRGRGKSAALGIAAARLLAAAPRRVILTAPRRVTVAPALERIEALLGGEVRAESGGLVHRNGGAVLFRPPEDLARDAELADLVLVDEAAAIPVPQLLILLKRYPRIAFATTVHGYEGTGRGFEVRFRHALDTETRGWRRLWLTQPVRWAAGDPLEALVGRLLLLDAEPAAGVEGARDIARCHVGAVDRDELVADEQALGEAFGLLIQAHYRTRPRDLRHLLDGPSVRMVLARCEGHVVGVALWALEGGFDTAMAEAITSGGRRPHGHLLPEALAAHLGLSAAPGLRAARIVRLAVHPEWRRHGVGSALVNGVREGAGGCDYLGASFAADAALLAFWRQQGFGPVRLSHRAGALSGAESVVLLQPLTAAGGALHDEARACCADDLPMALGDVHRGLEPELALGLLAGLPIPEPSRGDWVVATDVAAGQRLPEARPAALWRVACWLLAALDSPLTRDERQLLLLRLLQRRSWKATANALGLTGRREASAMLRQALARAVEQPQP